MTEGYGAVANSKESRVLWSETEEDELRTLFMEHQTNNYTQGETQKKNRGQKCTAFLVKFKNQ